MDTHIEVVIDRSGSMGGLVTDTIGGFNVWLEKVKEGQLAQEAAGKKGQTYVGVTVFGSLIERTVEPVAVAAVPALGTPRNPYRIEGNTALLQAVGMTLTEAERQRSARGKKGGKCLAVIITDGYENASQGWDTKRLASVMAELERWDCG